MPIFFSSLKSLHHFSVNLALHRDRFQCPQCQTADHFISHGYVYKKQSQGDPVAVGKRVFCSNRYQHRGCGRTQRLYLCSSLPLWHFPSTALSLFIATLIAGCSIQKAYQRATGTDDPRQGYRWLGKLTRRLSQFRTVLSVGCIDLPAQHSNNSSLVTECVQHLSLLLSTMESLFALFSHEALDACASFQWRQQQPFA